MPSVSSWQPAWGELAVVAALAAAYVVAWRRHPASPARGAAFAAALLLILAVSATPVATLAFHYLLSAHLLQNVVLAEWAPALAVGGLSAGMAGALARFAAVRWLTHPLVALPLWVASYDVWHVPALYEAALRWEAVHALEHILFFTCGSLMWAPVVEVLPGAMWFGTGAKLGYIVVVRMLETVLGNVFFWMGSVAYETYERSERVWGISPLADQGIAGGIMMIEGSVVTLGALAWLFLRLAGEGELRQELLERGVDPRAVRRAVRYGRGRDLAVEDAGVRD